MNKVKKIKFSKDAKNRISEFSINIRAAEIGLRQMARWQASLDEELWKFVRSEMPDLPTDVKLELNHKRGEVIIREGSNED